MTVCVVLPWLLELGGRAVPGAPGLGVSECRGDDSFFLIGAGYRTGNECKLQKLVHSELVLYLKGIPWIF